MTNNAETGKVNNSCGAKLPPGRPDRPRPVQGDLGNLPAALGPLTLLPHWVAWKFMWVENKRDNSGKWTKPPFNPRNPRWHAQNNSPKTWGSYDEALRASRRGDFAQHGGIGFNLLGADLAALDLDKCRDPATGAIEEWALALVRRAGTYAEVSPSGTGLRIIGQSAPESGRVHGYPKIPGAGHVEVYRHCERYITVTGLQIDVTPNELGDIDALIDELAAFIDAKPSKPNTKPKAIELPADLPAVDLDVEFSFLSPEFRRLIRTGLKQGDGLYDGDRSKFVWHVACALARAEVAPEKIAAVILDESYGVSDHVYDQPDPQKYAARQVARALAAIAAEEDDGQLKPIIVLDFTNGKGRALTTTEWLIEQGELIAGDDGEIVENPWREIEDEIEIDGEIEGEAEVEGADDVSGGDGEHATMQEADVARFIEPDDTPSAPSQGDEQAPPQDEPEASHPQDDAGSDAPPPRDKPKAWAQPTLFDPWAEYDLPEFPLDILPEAIARYVENDTISMGCDPSAFAMSLLAALSGAIPHQLTIKGMHSGDWTERPNLWTVLIAPPGEKKSPMVSAAIEPLKVIQNNNWQEHKRLHDAWEVRAKARKAKGKDADGNFDDEPQRPQELLAGDTTYEKLVRMMHHSPNGMLGVFDELSQLLGGFDVYKKGGGRERGFWLNAWSGGYYQYSRVGDGGAKSIDIHIQNCSISLIGGIQMAKLRQYADIVEDGLLQRFLPVIMTRSECPQEIHCDSGRKEYFDLVERCTRATPGTVILSDQAREVFDEFRHYCHELKKASRQGFYAGFSEFVSKLDGYSLRLALVLHVIHNPECASRLLSGKIARDAVRLVKEFILPHAEECYRTFEAAKSGDRLKVIGSYILTATNRDGSPKTTFVPSDFTANVPLARGMGVKQVEELIGPFVAHDWLDEADNSAKPTRGKKAQVKWVLNLAVRAEFAKREAAERDRKQLLAELMGAPRRRDAADGV